jgi:hypothetical protein
MARWCVQGCRCGAGGIATHFCSAGQFSGRGLQTASCLLRQPPPKHLSRAGYHQNDQRISEVDAVVRGLILGVRIAPRDSVSGTCASPTSTFISTGPRGGVEVIGIAQWRDRDPKTWDWGNGNPWQWISTTVLPQAWLLNQVVGFWAGLLGSEARWGQPHLLSWCQSSFDTH